MQPKITSLGRTSLKLKQARHPFQQEKMEAREKFQRGGRKSALIQNALRFINLRIARTRLSKRRKNLYEEYYEKNKSVKSVKIDTASWHRMPKNESGRYRICFEEKVDSTVLGDYGEDLSAISKSTFKKILAKEPNIVVKVLYALIELECAFKSNGTGKTL